MQALILGGESRRNVEWVRGMSYLLEGTYQVFPLSYEHWRRCTNAPINLEREIGRTAAIGLTEEPVVVAKSIGTVVATLASARGLITPRAHLFVGFPLDALTVYPQANEIVEALGVLSPTTLLQNEHDPFGSAGDVANFFADHAPSAHRVFTIRGGITAEYEDLMTIARVAARL